MNGSLDLAIAASGGTGGTLLYQTVSSWWKSRTDRHRADRDVDAQLEEHRDQLTFDLLKASREELSALRTELVQLRPLSVRVAHLEEALDHIHALLHADGDAERGAADRRARAFLRRMRPDIGDLRNAAQISESAKRFAKDVKGADA